MNKILANPNGALASSPDLEVKVTYQGRPPSPWCWDIVSPLNQRIIRRSEKHYRSAEQAWTDGKRVLEQLTRR